MPTELEAEIARASSEGQEAWVAARAASDFKSFAPYLERILELTRRYVDCHLGHDDSTCAYDVLIDDYEPGIRTARVADLFSELKGELVPMIATLARATPVDDSPLSAHFATDGQRTLARETVALMGFDEQGWRIDDTVHPFAIRIGPGDVRITTRWDEAYWPMSLYGAMHECGHGLYEAGIAPELRRTPIGAPQSLGVHESQSRLWENMVGRGRAFCTVLAPRVARAGRRRAGGDRRRPSVPRDQPRQADVHPGRGRRGDLRVAHHPAVRARAGADRGTSVGRRSPRGVERALQGLLRHRGDRRRRRRAAGRALVGGNDRLLPNLCARAI